MPQYQKVQSVAKLMMPPGAALDKLVLDTMATISSIVGATLGPGGRPVLIERQEYGLPPMVTKDGVTVYRSLGFDHPVAQALLEASRDASVRTANEAGDGTTTATILSEAVVRRMKTYISEHPQVSPQRVVRRLEELFRKDIEPMLKEWAIVPDMSTDEGRLALRNVAKVSANGDEALADAVMQCFDLVGDDGNVTIAESIGASKYEVERIEGYPIPMGFEESAAKFYPKFINDASNQRCLMEKPLFIVYHGRVQDPQTLFRVLERLGEAFETGKIGPNVVLVATGFSENVLGYLGMMFVAPNALNVFPLQAPQSPFPNGQLDFLGDIAAVTGAEVLDPLNTPLEQAVVEQFGQARLFESYRFRSNVIGQADQDSVFVRVDTLQANLARAESQLEQTYLQERIGKLTGGIARLKVIGSSNGELKEKRDRAEDAVSAVRGAIKHGYLPGGGWALLRLTVELQSKDPVITDVLAPALLTPFYVLMENAGLTVDEAQDIRENIVGWIQSPLMDSDTKNYRVYDALEQKMVDPMAGGILDSMPAVREAIRNSLSIASLLGTLGGTVAFKRDLEFERAEARDVNSFLRDAGINTADERA